MSSEKPFEFTKDSLDIILRVSDQYGLPKGWLNADFRKGSRSAVLAQLRERKK